MENDSNGLDELVATAFGRPKAVTESSDRAMESTIVAVSQSELQALAAASAAPWRAACRENERATLAAAEARFVDLVSSRRGQSPTAAKAYVEQTLREAWHNPATGFGATQGRLDSVSATIREGIASLEKIPPLLGSLSPTATRAATAAREAAKSRRPRRSTRTVREVRG